MSGSSEPGVKHIADIVGEWGRWQFNFSSFCFILWAASAINNLGYSFHAYDNKYWCSDVPKEYPNKTDAMKCFKFTNPNETCTEWQYDRSEFDTSINIEFNLVCGRRHFGSISQSMYMLGYVVSGLVFAHYSDKFGRRPVTWLSFILDVTGILICASSVNIYMYLFGRFLVGIGNSGRGMAVHTTLLEICGPKYRSDIMVLGGIGWVLGYALIPGLAYWLQNFRYMQFVSAIPIVLMMCWFYFLDESPRWQVINGHIDRAEVTLRKALKMNGKDDTDLKENLNHWSSYLKKVQQVDEVQHSLSVLDLLKRPNLRTITLILWYSWAVNALLYYGISFNMSDFGGNFYITFLLSGLVELPSQLLSALLLRYIGRPKLYALFCALTASSCLAVIPSTSSWLRVTFALIGKFSINSSWIVMSMLGLELFPTILRSTGMGSASVVGRIGSITAPFMKNLAITSGLSTVMIIYAILMSIGSILGLILPETKGREVPDTIEEAENANKIELKILGNKNDKS